jgi:hypothetical protein
MIKAPINTIVVIESLPDNDRQTGTELYRDIIKRYAEYYGNKIASHYFNGKTKNQFLAGLDFIVHNCPYMNLGIALHIEAHGLGDTTGLYLADGSSVSWEELKPKLIKVNVQSDNQLYVTMATCFGRYLHEAIDIKLQSPFSGYISASKEVYVKEILEDYSPFFEELLKTGDILEAFKVLDSRKSNFIYKDVETMFNGILLDWLKNMRENKEFRDEFINVIKGDYNKVKEDWFPSFEEMPVEEMLEVVKVEFVSKYRKNFLFGKGR